MLFVSVSWLSWFANELSNVAFEIDTSPKGEPPLGASRIPSTCRERVSLSVSRR